jgi:hypothetical protein
VGLAFVVPLGESADKADEKWGIVSGKRAFMSIVARDKVPLVLLADAPEITAASLNLALVELGIAEYCPRRL